MNETVFATQIRKAQQLVRSLVNDSTCRVHEASAVPHTYSDKFSLAESVTTIANAACTDLFTHIGLDIVSTRPKLAAWFNNGLSVTLQMTSREYCRFLRKVKQTLQTAKLMTTTATSSVETNIVSTKNIFIYEV